MDTRHERIQEALRIGAAEFMARETNRQSLLTVTRAMLSDNNTRATIYLTVLPNDQEDAAVAFANRNKKEFVDFLKTRVRGGTPPHISFEVDFGEKNRQRLDELS